MPHPPAGSSASSGRASCRASRGRRSSPSSSWPPPRRRRTRRRNRKTSWGTASSHGVQGRRGSVWPGLRLPVHHPARLGR